MRYRIAAVGKLRRSFYRSGCDHYLTRLRGLATAEISEVREGRGADAARVREAEGKALLGNAQGHLVALDERGRSFRSVQLARHLTQLELAGTSGMTLLVGGAEGLWAAAREAADEMWSLSPLTLPHELARLVLLEQLYRAESIRANHPYHRE